MISYFANGGTEKLSITYSTTDYVLTSSSMDLSSSNSVTIPTPTNTNAHICNLQALTTTATGSPPYSYMSCLIQELSTMTSSTVEYVIIGRNYGHVCIQLRNTIFKCFNYQLYIL